MVKMKNCRNIPRSRSRKRNSRIKRISNGNKRKSLASPAQIITTSEQTVEEPIPNDVTIDLIASDDENPENSPNSSIKKKQRKRKSRDSSVIIDISENSMTNDDIIIDHISPSKELEVLEVLNNNSVANVTNDEDIQVVEKENNDDIVILHAKCKKVEEIQIIGQKQTVSPVLPSFESMNGVHKWKEKKRIMEPTTSNVKLNLSTGSSNKHLERPHFNAPMHKKKLRRKSGNIVNKKDVENKIRTKFKNNKKLLFENLTPKSKLSAIGGNVYSENPMDIPTSGLRPIIIDGSNVAFDHGRKRFFSCRGLEICINYFKERGHKVTAFVPHFRVKANQCDNPKLLEKLENQGDVILTPSRQIDGVQITSYDDRYIVQFAAVKGGVIVTKDNYKDLLGENPAWEDTIKFRLLQFTWAEDLLMFPNDPLGLHGPNLESFLSFS